MMKTFFKKYFWFLIVVIYLVWPWDLHPSLLDDMIVFSIYLFFVLRQARNISKARQAYQQSGPKRERMGKTGDMPGEQETQETLTLQHAYKLLHVAPDVSREALRQAYHASMASNHPDKVAHLSAELQQRAQELTQRLNRAYEMIQRHKKFKS